MTSKIIAILSLLLIFTGCGKPRVAWIQESLSSIFPTEGTSTGNPMLPFDFEGLRGYLTLEVCVDDIEFSSGNRVKEIEMYGTWMTLRPGVSGIDGVAVPIGVFDTIAFELEDMCQKGVSARLTNRFGTFELRYDSQISFLGSISVVKNSEETLNFNMDNYMEALESVQNENEFFIALMSTQGTF